MGAWGQMQFFGVVEAFFAKLLRSHVLLHNHPNNCCGLVNLGRVVAPRVFELTLLLRCEAEVSGYVTSLPHELDNENLVDRDDIRWPRDCYGG